jgi:hypothetical protein
MDIVENISPQHCPLEEIKEPTPQGDEPVPEENPVADEVKDIDPLPQVQAEEE